MKYYVGEHRASFTLLQKAVVLYDKSAHKRGNDESARLYLMYGLSQFRLGNSLDSEKSFKQASRFCSLSSSKECKILSLITKANMAMIKVHRNCFKEAGELAREAVEIAERECSKEGVEVSSYIRILLHVYLRGNDMGRAERLLKSSGRLFKPSDLTMYRAGLMFCNDNIDEALCLLKLGLEENSISSDHSHVIPAMFYNLSLLEKIIHDQNNLSSGLYIDYLEIAYEKLENFCNVHDTVRGISNDLRRETFNYMDPNVVNTSSKVSKDVVATVDVALSHVASTLSEAYLSLSSGCYGARIQSGKLIIGRAGPLCSKVISEVGYGMQRLLNETRAMLMRSFELLRKDDYFYGGMLLSQECFSSHVDSFVDKNDETVNRELNIATQNGRIGGCLQNAKFDDFHSSHGCDCHLLESFNFDRIQAGKFAHASSTLESGSNSISNERREDNREKNDRRVRRILTDAGLNSGSEDTHNPEFTLGRNIAYGYIDLINVSAQKHLLASNAATNRLQQTFQKSLPGRELQKDKTSRTVCENADKPSSSVELSDVMSVYASNTELCTLRSELLPTNSKLDVEEVENWMQWTIASSKGMGFGAFGHNGIWENEVSYDILRDLRNRLLLVETNDAKNYTTMTMLNSYLSMQVIFGLCIYVQN